MLITNFVAQSISVPPTLKLVLQAKEGILKKVQFPLYLSGHQKKVSLREERLKIRTENISRAQTEGAKHSVTMEKQILQDRDSPTLLKESLLDCKNAKFFGPPILGEFAENLKTEVEHLKEELSQAKEKEHIFRFGLERFEIGRAHV